MFLIKVCWCFLILKFNLGVGFMQGNNNRNLGTKQETSHQPPEPSTNFSQTILEENNASVYRNQNFNDSMEKIQLVKNGTVMKSSFIPLVNESDEYDSDEDQVNFEEKESDIAREPIQVKELMVKGTENFIMKNGKKYRIVKVKKNKGNAYGNLGNTVQRRSFKLFNNLLSIVPVKWVTKGQTEKSEEKEIRSDNATEWSRLPARENTQKTQIQNSEKFQKLLNLFTIVKFDNRGCYSDGMKGTCLHLTECQDRGGKYTARCAGELGVCCYFEKTCGEVSKENCTYFVNEGFPESSTQAPKVCTLTIEKAHPDVKQLRLDFLIFQLKEPTNGTCLHDRLVISGQDTNDNVPDICGMNTGQHIYIDMEDSNGPYNLNLITVGEYFHRNFRIKVTQIRQQDPLLAPKNCLQYYVEPAGYVQTFNYQNDVNVNIEEIYNGYFNNLNYAICIKKFKGFCSISYENEETESLHPTFQFTNVDEEGERLLPPQQAGAETFDCPDDYIIVNGIRLCGEKLNDATIEIDYTRNYPVTDTSNGPFILSVKTDGAVSGRGFNLKYTQHPCLV